MSIRNDRKRARAAAIASNEYYVRLEGGPAHGRFMQLSSATTCTLIVPAIPNLASEADADAMEERYAHLDGCPKRSYIDDWVYERSSAESRVFTSTGLRARECQCARIAAEVAQRVDTVTLTFERAAVEPRSHICSICRTLRTCTPFRLGPQAVGLWLCEECRTREG